MSSEPGFETHAPHGRRASADDGAPRRILVVEDEMFVAMDIEAAVLKAGHQVVGFAGTAQQAVALADEKRPDLVLMDIRLAGGGDGVDAAIEIRRRFNIPSLIVSAYYDAETRARAAPAKILGFIPKPFDHALLAAALNGALRP
ncbi:MAG: response regulator [Hyphomicrobium sp.]|nr:response regulator [Hyphomicrobium sp.]